MGDLLRTARTGPGERPEPEAIGAPAGAAAQAARRGASGRRWSRARGCRNARDTADEGAVSSVRNADSAQWHAQRADRGRRSEEVRWPAR